MALTYELGDGFSLASFGFGGYGSETVASYGYVITGQDDEETISDLAQRSVDLLIEQFEKKPLITGVVRSFVDQLQEIEYELTDIKLLRFLDNAIGEQLDGIGDIVGVSRYGLSDGDYKALIQFQIFVNAGNGEPETVISALKFLTQAARVKYDEIYPAAVALETNGPVIPDRLYDYIQGIVPAGVRVDSIKHVPLNPFAFGSVSSPPSVGGGYSDVSQAVGGQYAGLIT